MVPAECMQVQWRAPSLRAAAVDETDRSRARHVAAPRTHAHMAARRWWRREHSSCAFRHVHFVMSARFGRWRAQRRKAAYATFIVAGTDDMLRRPPMVEKGPERPARVE